MKTLLYHPTGNAFVRAATVGFSQANLLAGFHTSIATFPGDLIDRISKFGPMAELGRRRFDPILKSMTFTSPWQEAGRLLAMKAGFNHLVRHEKGPLSIDAVYQSMDRRIARSLKSSFRDINSVYAYEDGALSSFKVAKSRGLQCFYDLPIGYWRSAYRLLDTERERWPEWACTLTGFNDSKIKLARKDDELRLADQIFVASQFTAATLKEFHGKLAPIHVIPYGFPPVGKPRSYSGKFRSCPLKLLFVGGLSQRKGIADLFAAVKAIGHHVELTIVGNKVVDNCHALNSALSNHRWIPTLPHDKILALMRIHDVLIFPSLFEGFGLVITEAMSQGTPVITTERTAGPDLIQHGRNGWLTKAGSTEALQSAIEKLLLQPAVIEEVGREAMAAARLRPWEKYGNELAQAIMKHNNL